MPKRRQGYLRIKKQIETLQQQIKKKEITSIEILSIDEYMDSITLSFSGPLDSPYEGFWFRAKISWPIDYPYRPPIIYLLDPIWNPFFDFQRRQVCMDILGSQFSPALTLNQYVLSMNSLLSETKISHIKQGFMNADAAIQMMKNYPLFQKNARKHCLASSYKKHQIYNESMRGLPEQHQIQAQQEEINEMKNQNKITKKFDKKEDQILRRRLIRKRQMRKLQIALRQRRQKYRQLKIKYGYGDQEKKAQIEENIQEKADQQVNNQSQKNPKC